MSANGCMHTGGAQDFEQIWPGMTAVGLEPEDILLIMAPLPVLVLAVTYDFFPIEATRQTVARARKFWDICEKSKNLELFEQVVDHHYTREMAVKSAEFFSRHLLGRKVKVDNSEFKPIPAAQLYCTKTGQLRGEFKNAKFVHEENVANVKAIHDEAAYCGSCSFIKMKLPLTIAIWDDGTKNLRGHMDWIRSSCVSGRAVMVLNVTGVGAIEPKPINASPLNAWYGTICRLSHDLLWLGDSLTAFRTYDVIRAIDVAQEIPDVAPDEVEVYGHGRQGVYALLAAAIDPRIKSLREDASSTSYSDFVCSRHYDDYDINSVILPGILRYCDLPDLRKWLGNRHVKNRIRHQ